MNPTTMSMMRNRAAMAAAFCAVLTMAGCEVESTTMRHERRAISDDETLVTVVFTDAMSAWLANITLPTRQDTLLGSCTDGQEFGPCTRGFKSQFVSVLFTSGWPSFDGPSVDFPDALAGPAIIGTAAATSFGAAVASLKPGGCLRLEATFIEGVSIERWRDYPTPWEWSALRPADDRCGSGLLFQPVGWRNWGAETESRFRASETGFETTGARNVSYVRFNRPIDRTTWRIGDTVIPAVWDRHGNPAPSEDVVFLGFADDFTAIAWTADPGYLEHLGFVLDGVRSTNGERLRPVGLSNLDHPVELKLSQVVIVE